MRTEWLLHSGTASEVIVVFGGWAVGPGCVAHLQGPQDVLFVEDYTDLEAELPDLSGYARRRLLAWSFGVSAYAHWQAGRADPFTRKTAIAGTLNPVDRAEGIPPAVLEKTRDTLSEASFATFQRRCFGGPQVLMQIDVPRKQAELTAVAARGRAPQTAFDRIVIPTRDRIFPPANMARAWVEQEDRVQQIDAPHAPFASWTTWQEVP
jgi:biotin synthesis protein BioG